MRASSCPCGGWAWSDPREKYVERKRNGEIKEREGDRGAVKGTERITEFALFSPPSLNSVSFVFPSPNYSNYSPTTLTRPPPTHPMVVLRKRKAPVRYSTEQKEEGGVGGGSDVGQLRRPQRNSTAGATTTTTTTTTTTRGTSRKSRRHATAAKAAAKADKAADSQEDDDGDDYDHDDDHNDYDDDDSEDAYQHESDDDSDDDDDDSYHSDHSDHSVIEEVYYEQHVELERIVGGVRKNTRDRPPRKQQRRDDEEDDQEATDVEEVVVQQGRRSRQRGSGHRRTPSLPLPQPYDLYMGSDDDGENDHGNQRRDSPGRGILPSHSSTSRRHALSHTPTLSHTDSSGQAAENDTSGDSQTSDTRTTAREDAAQSNDQQQQQQQQQQRQRLRFQRLVNHVLTTVALTPPPDPARPPPAAKPKAITKGQAEGEEESASSASPTSTTVPCPTNRYLQSARDRSLTKEYACCVPGCVKQFKVYPSLKYHLEHFDHSVLAFLQHALFANHDDDHGDDVDAPTVTAASPTTTTTTSPTSPTTTTTTITATTTPQQQQQQQQQTDTATDTASTSTPETTPVTTPSAPPLDITVPTTLEACHDACRSFALLARRKDGGGNAILFQSQPVPVWFPTQVKSVLFPIRFEAHSALSRQDLERAQLEEEGEDEDEDQVDQEEDRRGRLRAPRAAEISKSYATSTTNSATTSTSLYRRAIGSTPHQRFFRPLHLIKDRGQPLQHRPSSAAAAVASVLAKRYPAIVRQLDAFSSEQLLSHGHLDVAQYLPSAPGGGDRVHITQTTTTMATVAPAAGADANDHNHPLSFTIVSREAAVFG